MHQTRKLSFIFVAHWSLILHARFVTSTPRGWVHTLPTFRDPNNDFQSAVVDHNITGDVFVAGRNVLYHFSADLELKQSVKIGPLEDYPGCLIPPYPCSRARVQTDNDVRLMIIVYYFGTTPSLLLCGSVYNLCQVRPIDDLDEYHWVHPYNESIGFTSNQGSSYALFERGYGGQMSLFTSGWDYRKERIVPFLSSRVFARQGDSYYYFRYSFQSDSATSAVTIKGKSSRFPIDEGFVHENFIYFPVVYESPGIFSNNVESRLVRFCITDPTFQSYAELPLHCKYYNNKTFMIMAAYFGESRTSTGKALYAFFNDPRIGSSLCIFEMSSIVEAFTNSTRLCNQDIDGETCKSKGKNEIVDFCRSNVSPYVVNHPLEVNHFIFLPNLIILTLKTVKHNDELVVIAGANVGVLLKISMTTGKLIYMKDLFEKRTKAVFKRFVFDNEHKHIYMLIKNQVIKYPVASCGAHETCQDCFAKGRTDPLKCGWCAGRCAHLRECADPDSFSLDSCTPTIYEVFPRKGPIQGGNTVKITGNSLGSYVDEAHNSILIAGIPCNVSSWNTTQVNCLLGSTKEEISGPVQLNVINSFSSNLGYTVAGSTISQSNFSYYVGTRVYGLHPSKGPTSGGTIVTLFGEDLDFDKNKNRSISVNGRLCTLKRFDKNMAMCITGNTSSSKFPNATAIYIDGVAFVLDKHPPSTFNLTGLSQSFEYTPDPYITHIRPGITTMSGIINLTANGHHLDSVQFPKLAVKVAETQIIGDSEFLEKCWTDPKSNGTRMTCRTPDLKNKLIFPTPTRTNPLVAQVSFIMDGVQRLRELPKHREDLSRLLYYPDPVFRVFQETEEIKKDQNALEIKLYEGINLELMQLADNLQVRIGKNESCRITSVSSDILLCDLPLSIFSNSSVRETDISVEVITGSIIHHLGYIQLGRQNESEVLWIGLFVMALIVVSLCVIFVAYKCSVRRRRKQVHKVNNVALSNQSRISHDYHAVPTRAVATSSCSEHPAPDAVAKVQVAVAGLPDAFAGGSVAVARGPVTVAGGTVAVTGGPVAVAGYPVAVPGGTVTVAGPVANAGLPVAVAGGPVALTGGPVAVAGGPVAVTGGPVAVTGYPVAFAGGPVNDAGVTMAFVGCPVTVAQSPCTELPLVDNDTLILLADKDLIILKRFLVVGEKIGSGQFGCVFEGFLQRANETERTKVAVKTLREHSWSDSETVENFLREALLMKDFDHPNVLRLLGVCFEGGGPSIVLPFMENKDLHAYMVTERVLFTVNLLKFAVDATAGMAYLERKRFLHRDLAARNCVLDSSLTVKVADFGLSRDIYMKNYYSQSNKAKIPYRWTAPEALDKWLYTTKSDVWSYGVLLWEIMTRGSIPYSHIDNYHLLQYLKSGYRLDQPEKCPLPLYKAMLACWNIEPNKRPTFNELHDYVGYMLEMILNRQTEALPAAEAVPAENTVYYNSEHLYLNIECQTLNKCNFHEVSQAN